MLFIAAAGLSAACTQNTRLTYDPDMHDVYFDVIKGERDSVYVSLYTCDEVSAHTLKVNMLGNVLPEPMRFAVEVIPEKTTAVEGVHYKKLPEYYEFPAGVFQSDIVFELIKSDPELAKSEKVLGLRLVQISKLGIGFRDRMEIRVKMSTMLRVPQGSDMNSFVRLFGPYSRVKHEMIIEITGHDLWDSNNPYLSLREGYYTPYARKLYKVITEKDYYDETGNLITPWELM